MDPLRLATAAGLAGLVLAGPLGCFNDAFRGHEFEDAGLERFALVIEADRTDVEGTHFLVDRATGDLWVLDGADRDAARWLRLAEAPADAVPLSALVARRVEAEEPGD